MPGLLGLKGAEADMLVRGKRPGLKPGGPVKMGGWRRREVGGIPGVAVKCRDYGPKSDFGGSPPAPG